ncbi:MAG: helix-turn-helix domain-containing protein [Candidatus Peregrinibacteria bacterium]|nr:helix-turn-helix domain-containing protein [Candidatus Peregrinibacteria bacterium]
MTDLLTQQGCPSRNCKSYGNSNDVVLHDKKLNRLRCKVCGKTWSAHHLEFHFGLRTDTVKVRRAVDMLKAEIPIRKIARLVDVSAGTVMRWKKKLNKFN